MKHKLITLLGALFALVLNISLAGDVTNAPPVPEQWVLTLGGVGATGTDSAGDTWRDRGGSGLAASHCCSAVARLTPGHPCGIPLPDSAGGSRASHSVGREPLVTSGGFPRLTSTALDVGGPCVEAFGW
jgi:hypothetical protein